MHRFLSYYYTILCVLAPVFVLYSFTRNSYTMTDTFIFGFYLLSLPYSLIKGFRVILPYLCIFIYILIHSGYNMLISYDWSVFLRAMHLVNYIFLISFYHKTFYNRELGEKFLRFFAILSTLFLIIQQIAIVQFGSSISGTLFPQYAINEATQDLVVRGTGVHRMSSFFSEPAAYAVYIICALAHELFYRRKTDMRVVALFCLGCILSTSNTAIACMALLMGFYIYTNKLFQSRDTILLLLALIVIYFIATPHIEAINSRIEEGRSFSGRFRGYSVMFDLVDNPIWGIGFVAPRDLDVYLAGFPRLFVYLGWIGVALYFIVYLNIIYSTKRIILVLVFLFLNIGSDTLFGVSFLYYSCFIFSDDLQKHEKSVYRNHQLQQRSRT